MRERIPVLPLCLLAVSAFCADDKVSFKPQPYKPGKELNAKTYAEKPYTSSDKAAARPIGGAWTTDQMKPFTPATAQPFTAQPFSAKTPPDAKPFAAPQLAPAEPYTHNEKQTYVPSITPPPMMDEKQKKPFVVKTPYGAWTNKALSAEMFVPSEKPKDKNPMLQPRQGIKELPTDDAR